MITIAIILYLVFGATCATVHALIDSGTSGRPINPFVWVLITLGWFPILVYKISGFLWLVFDLVFNPNS